MSMKMQPILTTKLGNLYRGDCLDLTKPLPSESIDCFFADPPFNLKKDYGKHVDDNLSEQEYLEWCRAWIDEGVRLLRPGGSFFLYNIPKWNIHLASYLAQKLTFRNWITVELTFSLPISGRLYPSNYSLLYFVKGDKPNTFNPPRIPMQVCRHCGGEIKDYGGYKSKMNPKGISLSDVWTDIPPVRHQKYKNRAANALSLKLMDRILDIATVEGDVVFDPFGGSGTTYIAAELKGRRWIGVELSTTDAILDRFKGIADDKSHLEEIAKRKNVLFTPEALALRKKCGHSNDKYRMEEAPEPQDSLFTAINAKVTKDLE
jgi:site-specific DNA-methyltransferase (adenine-specific)